MKRKNQQEQESVHVEHSGKESASNHPESNQDASGRELAEEESVMDESIPTGHDSGSQSGQEEAEMALHVDCLEIINTLEAKLAETNEKFLRLFSEFDNYRKRTARERLELTKTATADVIASMLPVLDDLERAVSHPVSEKGEEPAIEGLVLILNKFKTILRQKGVEEIKSTGETFNTDFHEAVTHTSAVNEEDKGKIIDEIQKGYLLNGKVIRYASVVVAN